MLGYVDRQVRLYNEQGPFDSGLSRAFSDAAQINLANGDLARGRIFMERAVSAWRTSSGDDSPTVITHEFLTQNPTKHQLYGISMKWKTTVDDVPRGLGPEIFEDWLWRREKPQQRTGLVVDLRNRTTFPGFDDLPGEDVIDMDDHESSNMGAYYSRQHWCFLGEIVNFKALFRLQMMVKDLDGKINPLFFNTDRQGSELAPAQLQIGYTVAILHAHRHAFLSCIRLEDMQMIKV